ncbi:MAG: glycosyltransferase family 4 protein [Candidatus Alcyoniella australis]|nr:glycosyltransferase family 4 protein [Candidatus Alcyoniella australis]
MGKLLHLLSQRPSHTGSGITLEALVSHARAAGWDQRVIVGVPQDDPQPAVGGLDPQHVWPLVFGAGELDFALPGMSDVMPYVSTRFCTMSDERLTAYETAWRAQIAAVVREFAPDVIHSHHVWILSSLVKDVALQVPVFVQSHATGLRQMQLCPQIAPRVISGCRRAERFAVLHQEHAEQLAQTLEVDPTRVRVVGAGYRNQLFHCDGRNAAPGQRLLYVGKYAAAKGLPWLLDAFQRLRARRPRLELHVAGSGGGTEADRLADRMRAMPGVVLHGQLGQPALAALMRTCNVCVLPSFFEGLPLVLIEALACGCRLVSTALPGVERDLALRLGPALRLVQPPRLTDVDTPLPQDLPRFVDDLSTALNQTLEYAPLDQTDYDLAQALEPFTWDAVYRRVETGWQELIAAK